MDKRLLILIGLSLLSSASFFTYRKLVYKPEAINSTIKPLKAIPAGDSIAYSDQTPGASRWKWNFGDGEFSADQSGHHTYLAAGSYPVNLTVYGPFGVLKSKEQIVTVTRPDIIASTPVDTVAASVAVKAEPKPVSKPAVTASAPIQMPPQQRAAQPAKPKPVKAEGHKQKGNVLEDLGDGEEIKR